MDDTSGACAGDSLAVSFGKFPLLSEASPASFESKTAAGTAAANAEVSSHGRK